MNGNDIEVHKCLSTAIPIQKGFIRFKGILHTKAYGRRSSFQLFVGTILAISVFGVFRL